VKADLSLDIFQCHHLEVRGAHPSLERAEGVFDSGATVRMVFGARSNRSGMASMASITASCSQRFMRRGCLLRVHWAFSAQSAQFVV
jgi:hypothetical protein